MTTRTRCAGIVLALVLVSAGCAQETTDARSGASMDYKRERRMTVQQPVVSGKKVLVVYTSQGSNTRRVAEDVAALLGAEVERVVDRKKRSGFFGFFSAGGDALSRKLTDIEPTVKDPADYDLVVLGTPVWAGNITPAMRTYLTQRAGAMKMVAFFTTAAGPTGAKTFSSFAEAARMQPVATLGISSALLKEGKTADYDAQVMAFAQVCAEALKKQSR